MIPKKISQFFHKYLLVNNLNKRVFSYCFQKPIFYAKNRNILLYSFGNSKNEPRENRMKNEFDSVFFQDFQKNYSTNVSEIFKMFCKARFLRFMNENYRLLPFLFSQNHLKEVFFFINSKDFSLIIVEKVQK